MSRTQRIRSSDDPLEEALADCLRRPSEGRAAALEATCEAHPDRSEELRRRYGPLIEHQRVTLNEKDRGFRTSFERRALLRSEEGDIDGALEDLEESRRLTARAHGESSAQVARVETLIDSIVDG